MKIDATWIMIEQCQLWIVIVNRVINPSECRTWDVGWGLRCMIRKNWLGSRGRSRASTAVQLTQLNEFNGVHLYLLLLKNVTTLVHERSGVTQKSFSGVASYCSTYVHQTLHLKCAQHCLLSVWFSGALNFILNFLRGVIIYWWIPIKIYTDAYLTGIAIGNRMNRYLPWYLQVQ